MTLIKPKIIAPDSSHWAKWIDASLSSDAAKRDEARRFHGDLLEAGRVPFLSWHHLEELLGVEDDGWARDRIGFIQSLPLIAFMRLPFEETGLGAITDILAAEALAASEGKGDAISIRNRAKEMLLRTGAGADAIGEDGWIWTVVRPEFRARNQKAKMITAVAGFSPFNANRTIGEISKDVIRRPAEMSSRLREMRASVVATIREQGDRRIADPEAMADEFIERVAAVRPAPSASVRDFIVEALVAQGVDEAEIIDDRYLSELNELAIFRAKLRVVASKTGKSFESLKAVQMRRLPNWLIEQALRVRGQKRQERKGSDLNDGYLAALTAYTDQLYVDKRTAEDFNRVLRADRSLSGLLGEVLKAPRYLDLLTAGRA